MDVLDSYGIQVSFDTVRFMIEQKQITLNENEKAYLERSISFLNEVTLSIDSLDMSNNDKKAYHFTPKLREIIGTKFNKAKFSKGVIDKSKIFFNGIKSDLELMMTDPMKIYSSPTDTRRLKKAISKIIDVFTGSPYIVENDFTLSGTINI
jgi:hypothetical protein